jgi:hypothetical protein
LADFLEDAAVAAEVDDETGVLGGSFVDETSDGEETEYS